MMRRKHLVMLAADHKPHKHALLLAFAPCFLWGSLVVSLQQSQTVSNTLIWLVSALPFAAACWVLFTSDLFASGRRVAKVTAVLLVALTILGSAIAIAAALLVALLRWTGGQFPLPL